MGQTRFWVDGYSGVVVVVAVTAAVEQRASHISKEGLTRARRDGGGQVQNATSGRRDGGTDVGEQVSRPGRRPARLRSDGAQPVVEWAL